MNARQSEGGTGKHAETRYSMVPRFLRVLIENLLSMGHSEFIISSTVLKNQSKAKGANIFVTTSPEN